MTEEILALEHVCKSFSVLRSGIGASLRSREILKAVVDVSLTVHSGETLGLVGESGCGKTTLGRLIVRLERPDSGRILYRQQDLAQLDESSLRNSRTRIQMVFQDPQSSLNPRKTIGDAITEPMIVHRIVPKRDVESARDRLLRQVGLSAAIAPRYPRELSGGQRQRVGIARALAVNPEIIIADEAVSSLDVSIRAQILNLLKDLKKEYGLTLIFISHDLSVVNYVSDRVGVMYLGRLIEHGTVDAVFRNPGHPYTRGLLVANPSRDPARKRRKPAITGDLPSAVNPPSGCVFRTRCPIVQPKCSEDVPQKVELGPDHWAACWFTNIGGFPGTGS